MMAVLSISMLYVYDVLSYVLKYSYKVLVTALKLARTYHSGPKVETLQRTREVPMAFVPRGNSTCDASNQQMKQFRNAHRIGCNTEYCDSSIK